AHVVIALAFVGKTYLILLLRFTRNATLLGWAYSVTSMLGIWLATYVDHYGREGVFEIGAAYTPYMIVSLVFISLIGTSRTTLYYTAMCLATLVAFFLIGSSYVYDGGMTPQGKMGLALRTTSVILATTIMIPVSTVIYQALDDLSAAVERARAAEEARSGFLATMSHEIRTPLNGILGMSDMLAKADIPTTEKRYAKLVQVSANSLMDIINEVLDMAKLEDGTVKIAADPFSPAEVVQDVCDLFGVRANDKSLWLGADVNGLPDALLGDAPHLRQVLSNLVGNALKFTQEGGVRIGARLISVQSGMATVQFYVQDTGVGIAPEEQTGIFDRFSQTSSAKTTKEKGTGLGLSICRELTEKMGGTLSLNSAVGQGTTFHFTLTLPISQTDTGQLDQAYEHAHS
ncbi:MAG: ATP-binding protein, partial [Pseudomonadota bacterium]